MQGGESGLNYYNNLGIGKWGLMMDEMTYNNVDVSKDHHAMMALLDSGNSTIQIPLSMYTKMISEMRKNEKSVYSDLFNGQQILAARKSCKDLYDVLGPIEFDLQGTRILIRPKGYLLNKPFVNDTRYCRGPHIIYVSIGSNHVKP